KQMQSRWQVAHGACPDRARFRPNPREGPEPGGFRPGSRQPCTADQIRIHQHGAHPLVPYQDFNGGVRLFPVGAEINVAFSLNTTVYVYLYISLYIRSEEHTSELQS